MVTPDGYAINTGVDSFYAPHGSLPDDQKLPPPAAAGISPTGSTQMRAGTVDAGSAAVYPAAQGALLKGDVPAPTTNIVRNGVGHSVTTHGQALGAGPGRGVSEPRQGNPGATRLRTAPDENVNVSALDSLHPQHPGLLKIDVEENEMAALQGASHAITELCSIVWFEALATADQTTVGRSWLVTSSP